MGLHAIGIEMADAPGGLLRQCARILLRDGSSSLDDLSPAQLDPHIDKRLRAGQLLRDIATEKAADKDGHSPCSTHARLEPSKRVAVVALLAVVLTHSNIVRRCARAVGLHEHFRLHIGFGYSHRSIERTCDRSSILRQVKHAHLDEHLAALQQVDPFSLDERAHRHGRRLAQHTRTSHQIQVADGEVHELPVIVHEKVERLLPSWCGRVRDELRLGQLAADFHRDRDRRVTRPTNVAGAF
mmetsp:Transcript_118860/g.343763  ORF Transcript_118860/g.343763 Transcript_118860/m.343763 type:complete len:241 (-) Transcript_118860:2782-3504(-)